MLPLTSSWRSSEDRRTGERDQDRLLQSRIVHHYRLVRIADPPQLAIDDLKDVIEWIALYRRALVAEAQVVGQLLDLSIITRSLYREEGDVFGQRFEGMVLKRTSGS